MFGRPIVHGMHLLIWAMDSLVSQIPGEGDISVCSADFRNALAVDENAECILCVDRLQVRKKSLVLMECKIQISDSKTEWPMVEDTAEKIDKACADPSWPEIESFFGSIQLGYAQALLAKHYPSLAARVPRVQIAVLLAASRLVGMVCPGRRSIFREIRLACQAGRKAEDRLQYRVEKADDRFSMVRMSVVGGNFSGTIVAHQRPAAQMQPSMAEVAVSLSGQEFAKQRAIVIGGSRGLGELVVKLLGAGGAETRFSYCRGYEDALVLKRTLVESGCRSECFQYDVLNSGASILDAIGPEWRPTHLYYFATPFISEKTGEVFSIERFEQFFKFYGEGFYRILNSLKELGVDELRCYFPSTVFLMDEEIAKTPVQFIEYASAKASGETMCRFLEQAFPHYSIFCPRLPRLRTDQTSSLGGLNISDNLACLKQSLFNAEQYWRSRLGVF